jgi:fructosamine-3-kinase
MIDFNQDQFYESILFQCLGHDVQIKEVRFVSGGCINNTLKLLTESGDFFLKWNEGIDDDMFEKEQLGLNLLAQTNTIKVPGVVGLGESGSKQFLVLDHISNAAPVGDFWELFGQQLADLHRNTSPHYGLNHDNFIGRLHQKNEQTKNWIDFFIGNRLEVQLGLALYNGHIDTSFAKKFRLLYPQLPGIIPNEPASLIHGDLWSGNYMVGDGGIPYIFDPAVYYGHREIELAFTRLFGGFDTRFYQAYHDSYPLEQGFEDRIDIYNLYPLLVHVNLFGTSYLSGIERTLRKYLK